MTHVFERIARVGVGRAPAPLSWPPVRRRSTTAIVAAACALAAWQAGGPPAGAALPAPGSAAIWATVDLCGGPAHPGEVGIRGAMPGTGSASESMFMRFAVEFHQASGAWSPLGGAGSSGFVAVGSAGARERQAGWDFTITSAVPRTFLLRGVVTFEWRRGGRVLADAVRSTTSGHHPGAGADPPGYSASLCRIAAKRRGSFVITPVTPSAARRASSAGSSTVHG